MSDKKSVITKELRDAIGIESEPVTKEIEKGAIIKFAEAIGDTNPIYSDEEVARNTKFGGIIAPPTFLRSIDGFLGPSTGKAKIESPYSAVVDGGSEWEYFEDVRPGDLITVTKYLSDLQERDGKLGSMLIMINEKKYVNQFNKIVAIQRTTSISYDPK